MLEGAALKSRFTGRKVDARIFLAEALRGERNFTDADLSGCDLAAYPRKVERFNQMMLDRCVPPNDPAYHLLVEGNWLDVDNSTMLDTLERNRRAFEANRFYFTQANMYGFCAIGTWLPLADLRYTYLDSSDMTESFLARAMFDDAEGPSLQAENVDLREASFCGARFLKANFSGSLLQGSRMLQANFVNSAFQHSNLNGAELENTDMSGCDFSHASLLRVSGLSSANWSGARFTRTKVKKEDVKVIKQKRELDGLDDSTPEHRALRKGK
jgi:uncharacterized protein YjbI with pentapeptide repeats